MRTKTHIIFFDYRSSINTQLQFWPQTYQKELECVHRLDCQIVVVLDHVSLWRRIVNFPVNEIIS